jgi:hypothetical protein
MDDEAQKEFKDLLRQLSLKEINDLTENFKHVTCYDSLLIFLRHSTHKV